MVTSFERFRWVLESMPSKALTLQPLPTLASVTFLPVRSASSIAFRSPELQPFTASTRAV